ncbi:MAG: hypothetical protein KatS3mg003_0389 [Candidatus Nitrosocaldaceae archaeon]|nr:MAG: hypothetical protein KatS3mg003_0389 [Candidatus Nitrosocaldaceae archaeon]
MTRLPRVSGIKVVKTLIKIGYRVDHQTGSHIILRHMDTHKRITVPRHKELAKGTLRAILREADLSIEEFVRLLR